MEKRENISMSIIKRLPRYYRFLQSLKDNGIVRISSKELADRMGLTASQIRHDFNSFGGFGQQGYGYNVPELQKRIGEILCVDKELKTILIGAGNLGKAVSNKIFIRQSGFKLIGIFDKNEAICGNMIKGIPVRHINYLENFCIDNQPVCAVFPDCPCYAFIGKGQRRIPVINDKHFFEVCVCFHQSGLNSIAQTVLGGLIDDIERLKGLHTG